jgi:cell shape-determining protein MreC
MDNGFSYSARSTNVGRRRLWIATIAVVALFGIDLLTGGGVRGVVRTAVAGVSQAVHQVGQGISGSGFFSTKASLAAENQSLKAQVAALEEQAALSSALQQQVIALQNLARLAQSLPGISAPVTSSFIASPYGTFLIGAGTRQGVTPGALVLSDEGVAVGTVSDASASSATVLEVFAPDHSVDAALDGAAIIVKGAGGGNATAQVPNGVKVQVGDAVTAPEYGGRTIGVVGNVDSNPSNAAMQVSIGSPVNLAAMQYVFVAPASQ